MEVEPKIFRSIMVSSTFTDLEAHRCEAIDAIHRFGFHANVMEYSGARSDADVIDASLQMVRESVAYVCVIGHKYGQTPVDDDRNPKGLSITELEFNEARRLGRPILLFLMAEDHPGTKADFESDTKKAKKLVAFRKQTKRVDPGKGAERVYETFASKDEFAKKAAIAVGLEAIRVAGGSDLPDRAIRDAIMRFIDVKPEANQAELTEAIERFETGYRALEQQLAAIAVTDNRVTSLKVAGEAALAEGDLDKARAAYREAAEAAVEKAAEPVRTAAELKSAEAGAHLLALDWQAADSAWTEAAAMLAPFNIQASEKSSGDAATRLSLHGELYACAGALSAGIDRWRTLAQSAGTRGNERESARLRNNLGNALQQLGATTGGIEGECLLNEAMKAHRDALTVYTRSDMPEKWAATQNHLGIALTTLGERTGGSEGLRLLEQGIAAYLAALTVYTRTDARNDWAMTQNNLGAALQAEGVRIPGPEGLDLLRQAVSAYRDALTALTRDDAPKYWAAMQNNLGDALRNQGARTGGPEGLGLLEEAITAFRAALSVCTRTDMPAAWAMTQNNLGAALHVQGAITGEQEGLRLLDQAVAVYRDTLNVNTPADMPAAWAMTQENIGLAFAMMAEVDPDRARAHFLAAEAALLAALEVYTPEHMAFYHDKAARSLAHVRARLAALGT